LLVKAWMRACFPEIVFEWLMRKIDTANGVSNFSSGGRVGIVVVVMVEVGGNEGVQDILYALLDGVFYSLTNHL